MADLFLSLNPILQMAWAPILLFIAMLAAVGAFTVLKFIGGSIVWLIKTSREEEKYDPSWMQATGWVLTRAQKGEVWKLRRN